MFSGLLLASALSSFGSFGVGISSANRQHDLRGQQVQQSQFNATLARNQARVSASEIEEQMRRTRGAQRASYGASGITLAGSPMEVLEDTFIQGAANAARQRHAGRIQAYNYQVQAHNYRLTGDSEREAGLANAFSGLLGGLGNVFMTDASFNGGSFFGGYSQIFPEMNNSVYEHAKEMR